VRYAKMGLTEFGVLGEFVWAVLHPLRTFKTVALTTMIFTGIGAAIDVLTGRWWLKSFKID